MKNKFIEQAAKILQQGGVVSFPTETVYGLGADATNDRAVAKIFSIKNRPAFNPLIVHVRDIAHAKTLVEWNDVAQQLAQKYWPGPLTLVLPQKQGNNISKLVSNNLPTLAVRCPAHPMAQEILQKTNLPLAAPSANLSEHLSPTRADHVQKMLGNKVDLIIDGGACRTGIESTIVDATQSPPILLRHGAISMEDLKIFGVIEKKQSTITAPGQMHRHYAPRTKLRLNAIHVEKNESLLAFGDPLPGAAHTLNLSTEKNIIEAAANLFSMLHDLDQHNTNCIAVQPIPNEGLGVAINDRLTRAAN